MTLDKATAKQRQVLIAYLRYGSYKAAAKELGIREGTARSRVKYMCKIVGVRTVAEAAYRFGLEGFRLP